MKTRKITLWEQDWNNSGERPSALEKYTAWLAAKIAAIPEEYRASAEVEIEAEPSYEGSAVLNYRITYERPETDAERSAREAAEKRSEENRKTHELEQLKRLRAKYPDLA